VKSVMANELLSSDTEVVLLLCGRFGGERQEAYAPLSPREYGDLAKWLNGRGLRPSDLMGEGASEHLASVHDAKLERRRIEFLLGRGTAMALAMERWSRGGLWVVSRGDPAFPKRMRQRLKHGAPPLLYGAGDKSILETGGLAIVGSRDASESAREFARDIASRCAHEGMTVVSGGARGVDLAAMQGATEADGCCIGVLAADLLKSSTNRQNRIGLMSGRLVLVSPFHPEAGFNAGNAMGRNRHIYVLSDQALVVDSALGSGGTWQGAIENLQHRWVPTFVRVPGDGAGNSALIDKGGIPITIDDAKSVSLREFFSSRGVDEATKPVSNQATLQLSDKQYPIEGSDGSMIVADDDELSSEVPPATKLESALTVAMSNNTDENDLDLFSEFVLRLSSVFQRGPLTEEQISALLHLERGQTKTWLKRACEQGIVEKSKKPVMYLLVRQGSLC
jgi:predicted Rossmann fold nucleotide-binding protein DprA/Smf involved in DNA uptake